MVLDTHQKTKLTLHTDAHVLSPYSERLGALLGVSPDQARWLSSSGDIVDLARQILPFHVPPLGPRLIALGM